MGGSRLTLEYELNDILPYLKTLTSNQPRLLAELTFSAVMQRRSSSCGSRRNVSVQCVKHGGEAGDQRANRAHRCLWWHRGTKEAGSHWCFEAGSGDLYNEGGAAKGREDWQTFVQRNISRCFSGTVDMGRDKDLSVHHSNGQPMYYAPLERLNVSLQ